MLDIEKLRNTPVNLELSCDLFTMFTTSLVIYSQLDEPMTKPVQVALPNGKIIMLPPKELTPSAKKQLHEVAQGMLNQVLEFYIEERKNGNPN
jgi:NAD-dependent SIR2 family protein deacetylase